MTLTLVSILLLLIVAGVCGAIGQALAGTGRGGFFVSVALGFIGALFGTWLGRALHLPELFTIRVAGETFPIIWSIIGSAIFVALLSLLTRGRRL